MIKNLCTKLKHKLSANNIHLSLHTTLQRCLETPWGNCASPEPQAYGLQTRLRFTSFSSRGWGCGDLEQRTAEHKGRARVQWGMAEVGSQGQGGEEAYGVWCSQ